MRSHFPYNHLCCPRVQNTRLFPQCQKHKSLDRHPPFAESCGARVCPADYRLDPSLEQPGIFALETLICYWSKWFAKVFILRSSSHQLEMLGALTCYSDFSPLQLSRKGTNGGKQMPSFSPFAPSAWLRFPHHFLKRVPTSFLVLSFGSRPLVFLQL